MVFDGSGQDKLYAMLLFTNTPILSTTVVSEVGAPLGPRLKPLSCWVVGKRSRNLSAFRMLEAV